MHTPIPAPLHSNPEWVDLYQRLQAFQVSSYEDVPLAFLHKLARMNGWSHAHTERVFSEYKRFLFLTVVAGHFVCPCEAVDQTWHFHLIYTESYWEDLCGKVLGKALHHVPSRGGVAESNAFHRDYAQTLASYERFFGEPPPADIWERPAERLRDTPHLRMVNTRTHWLLPSLAGLLKWVGKVLFGLGMLALYAWLFYTFHVFGFVLILLGWLAYSLWSDARCPQCRTRHAFHATGVRSDDGKQAEYRCNQCGHTEWQAVSQSSGEGGGGCSGGCGGSGGSGGG
ncbi:MAG TPA: hypothetical protein PLE99_01530 [Candidatus Thiothrix moscowensis]|uniref:glycine-rich domain-containing protein n=1 Tax=unclassified Thiothrix TaxID=2636184 RepID=UPI0025F9FCE9|nr:MULTISPECIES: hypothetical protein [unclassified Thiothrix]HRJ51418.1 hypothetical protein [Candidatus Thiothrix moscowensis]HRJ91527.1 hypothetical protein [Candidatus Thiothrix moscowensis]